MNHIVLFQINTYPGPQRGCTYWSNTQVAEYLDRLSKIQLRVTSMKIFMFQDKHRQIDFHLAMWPATNGIIKFPTSPPTLGNRIYLSVCIHVIYVSVCKYVYAHMYEINFTGGNGPFNILNLKRKHNVYNFIFYFLRKNLYSTKWLFYWVTFVLRKYKMELLINL